MKKKDGKRIRSLLMRSLPLVLVMWSCSGGDSSNENDGAGAVNTPLPYLGDHDVEFTHNAEGEMVADTVYYTIPKFSFISQDSLPVSHRDYSGKIFVAEFFFTNCKSICPIMSTQMVRLQALVKKDSLDDKVMFLSHTVDPANDTPAKLKEYARSLGVDESNWKFATGNPEDIFWQAETGYMLTAFPSDTAQGGFFHTDKLTLVDKGMHIRGYYDGTSTKSIDQLFSDIKKLVNE